MAFRSVLFGDSVADVPLIGRGVPECFHDLRLDQVVAAITTGYESYDLQPFFNIPLRDVDSIQYRQEIFRDLENQSLVVYLQSFAGRMKTMRNHLERAEKSIFLRQRQSWFLNAVGVYCRAVDQLTRDLTVSGIQSRGMCGLLDYLIEYQRSPDFLSLAKETDRLRGDLATVRYCLDIVGLRIFVDRCGSEPDYGAEVLATFAKFQQEASKQYQFDLRSWPEMNHVEAGILDLVAQLHPDIFSRLGEYFVKRRFYLDRTIKAFDREIQFYLACHAFVGRFKTAGLSFCLPRVSQSKEIVGTGIFDVALAERLLQEKAPVVENDFYLQSPERIIVVSGPNQGGKTTFARTFGQLHYLASLGCPVPAKEAQLFLFDQLFTHFEKEENLQNLNGKLEDDLRRIHTILEKATSDSIVIMNESFVSTTLSDALYLSKEIMGQIVERDMLCVTVTFLDELASLGPTTVSMVSTVRPEDTTQRTFRIVRRPADGLAYAAALAAKYRLTYQDVKERLPS